MLATVAKDPMSSSLLNTNKEYYLIRLMTDYEPDSEESQWIRAEDVNIKHLLDVFTSVGVGSESVWNACSGFLRKPRLRPRLGFSL